MDKIKWLNKQYR